MLALIPGLLIGGIVILVLYLVSMGRRADSSASGMPGDRVSFAVNASSEQVQNAVLAYAEASGLNIEQIDPSRGVVILGENLSLVKSHNGFWLYISVTQDQTDHCVVNVAVKSKTFQAGFMLRPYRDRAANAIRASLVMIGKHVFDSTSLRSSPPNPAPPQ